MLSTRAHGGRGMWGAQTKVGTGRLRGEGNAGEKFGGHGGTEQGPLILP